jgi:hypothetical protein
MDRLLQQGYIGQQWARVEVYRCPNAAPKTGKARSEIVAADVDPASPAVEEAKSPKADPTTFPQIENVLAAAADSLWRAVSLKAIFDEKISRFASYIGSPERALLVQEFLPSA